MSTRAISAETAPAAVGGYTQAVECTGSTRRLYISGQIPVTTNGICPPAFADQARLVWHNLAAQLVARNRSDR
jgi:2-iminobutanoate/2-iminopropanoate deaminase